MGTPSAAELLRLARLGRRAEQRKQAAGKTIQALLAVAFTLGITSWLVMVLFQQLHEKLPAVPEIGYWWTLGVVALLIALKTLLTGVGQSKN